MVPLTCRPEQLRRGWGADCSGSPSRRHTRHSHYCAADCPLSSHSLTLCPFLSLSLCLPPPTTHAHTGAHTLLPLALSLLPHLVLPDAVLISPDASTGSATNTRCSTRPSSHPIENRLKLFRRLSEKASVNRQAAAGETPTPTHTQRDSWAYFKRAAMMAFTNVWAGPKDRHRFDVMQRSTR